jgi:hypothetical protein
MAVGESRAPLPFLFGSWRQSAYQFDFDPEITCADSG